MKLKNHYRSFKTAVRKELDKVKARLSKYFEDDPELEEEVGQTVIAKEFHQAGVSLVQQFKIMQQDLDELSQSPLLQEKIPYKLFKRIVASIAIAMVVFFMWSTITPIKDIARAKGSIIPSGHSRVVQHLEGGIIKDILVREGQYIEYGEELIEISGADVEKDFNELSVRQISLQLQSERLRALLESREPDFEAITSDYPEMVADQKKNYAAVLKARAQEREILSQQLAQKRKQLKITKDRVKTMETSLELASEARDIQKTLTEKGLSNRMRFLEKEEAFNSMQGDHQRLKTEITLLQDAVKEYQTRIASLDANSRDELHQQLEVLERDIAQNKESIAKINSRIDRLRIRAPVSGLVKGLTINTIGGVVAPGQKLLEIVPMDEELVADVHISPTDIGHVAIGQRVQVKVHAYDFTRFGIVDGTLEFISASTFIDETSENYYRGRVVLRKGFIGKNPDSFKLLPGMTLDADIVTGEKTVLAYLLKPVRVAMDHAFTER